MNNEALLLFASQPPLLSQMRRGLHEERMERLYGPLPVA